MRDCWSVYLCKYALYSYAYRRYVLPKARLYDSVVLEGHLIGTTSLLTAPTRAARKDGWLYIKWPTSKLGFTVRTLVGTDIT